MEETPARGDVQPPETEVRPPLGRRRFTQSYKKRILAELDACNHFGEKGALLRREGLYSSYEGKWRRQMAKKSSKNTAQKNTGGRPRLSSSEREARQLREENLRLKKQLERAHLAIEVQKKLSELLATYSPPKTSDDSSETP